VSAGTAPRYPERIFPALPTPGYSLLQLAKGARESSFRELPSAAGAPVGDADEGFEVGQDEWAVALAEG
jgi:hypothetical protein